MFAVFENLPNGSFSVEIWSKASPCPGCSNPQSTGQNIDPGGYEGKIIVKEVF